MTNLHDYGPAAELAKKTLDRFKRDGAFRKEVLETTQLLYSALLGTRVEVAVAALAANASLAIPTGASEEERFTYTLAFSALAYTQEWAALGKSQALSKN